MALNDCMADDPVTQLVDLIMRGAHDAGTYLGTELKGLGATSRNAHMQNVPIGQQLARGTRFFDLQLKLNKQHSGAIQADPLHFSWRSSWLAE